MVSNRKYISLLPMKYHVGIVLTNWKKVHLLIGGSTQRHQGYQSDTGCHLKVTMSGTSETELFVK